MPCWLPISFQRRAGSFRRSHWSRVFHLLDWTRSFRFSFRCSKGLPVMDFGVIFQELLWLCRTLTSYEAIQPCWSLSRACRPTKRSTQWKSTCTRWVHVEQSYVVSFRWIIMTYKICLFSFLEIRSNFEWGIKAAIECSGATAFETLCWDTWRYGTSHRVVRNGKFLKPNRLHSKNEEYHWSCDDAL